MAEQKADAYKKKQEELRQQYEKEQDLHDNKAMLSKDSKDKLSISFMYEPPPGARKEREREDNEPEYKFEWQRKYNAPRESYCKGDQEIRDQPFGIQVRNVRCIKCHKWGHINTDKECPMYSLSMSAARSLEAGPALDQGSLVQQMLEDGLALKKQHVNVIDSKKHNLMLDEDENENSEASFLKSLTKKQKKALLKKLEKLEKESKSRKSKKMKKESDSEDSDYEKRKNKKKHFSRKRKESVSSEESSEEERGDEKKKKSSHYKGKERRSSVDRKRKSDSRDYSSSSKRRRS